MSTVYIVQEPLVRRGNNARPDHKYSLEPAKKYGELRVLMDWGKTRTPVDVDKLYNLLAVRLVDFNPTEDFLLLSGNPGLIALAAMALAQNQDGGQVKMLIWDRVKQDYDVWPVNLYTNNYDHEEPYAS